MVDPSADGVHVQSLWAKRDSQLLGPSTIGQHGSLVVLQQVGEDDRSVIAAQKVPLSPTQGQEREVLLMTATLIRTKTTEEEDQELFICGKGTGDEVNIL